MATVPCFLLAPTSRDRVSLRRYSLSGERCSAEWSYHDAQVPIGEQLSSANGAQQVVPHDDPRWPKKCDRCAYVFTPEDAWQEFLQDIFRTEDGREFLLREAPPGALWRATWFEDRATKADVAKTVDPVVACSLVDARKEWVGADGQSWVVKLPDGTDWAIDGPSNGGGRWTRTGVAPKFTVTPSILTPKYHGWLRDGVLSDA